MDKNAILKRKAEIQNILKGNDDVDLDALQNEINDLNSQLAEIEQREKRQAMAARIQAGEILPETKKPGTETELEKRGKALKEKRAITVATTGVIVPDTDSTRIVEKWNEISSLLDRVSSLNLNGGDTFYQSYEITGGEGDYTAEGDAYTTAEGTFGLATISKAKVTSYNEISEELEKLPNANYAAVVQNGVLDSIRKKITKEILVGTGATNHLMGIFNASCAGLSTSDDLSISEINEETLDNIIYTMGGDLDVEGLGTLILNKLDLKKFATLRDTTGRKIHNVVNRGNTGTIDGVPYIINNACYDLDNATTGQYLMAYGPLQNYLLAIFSPVDIRRSEDFKFSTGMICNRGSIFVGGNCTKYKGFVRVKKA